MKWLRHKELSESDLDFLIGSDIMSKLLKNKLIVKFHEDEEPATPAQMGLHNTKGVYHMRHVNSDKKLIEILFELTYDMDRVEESLTQYKLSL